MKFRLIDKTKALCPLMLSVLLAWSIVSSPSVPSRAEEPRPRESLLRFLPRESDLPGWRLDGEPQTAEGIGLFELINGGAEEYLKEGFSRAVLATYRNREGKRINLEIYEMLSPESARKIHLRKTGGKGQKVSLGEEAVGEDHYLNFRKGAYQVTLSGDDTQRETLEWLLRMARLVAERIGVSP